MDKVTSIPSKEERFADPREDRSGPVARSPRYRLVVREYTKTLAPLYKALRLDQRFAAPQLALALTRYSLPWWLEHMLYRPLNSHNQNLHWDDVWSSIDVDPHHLAQYTAAHVSLKDPQKIACYPTRADAVRRREVVMTAGKFYAAANPDAEASKVQAFAEKHAARHAPVTVHFIHNNDYDDLQSATDKLGDEWVRVYQNPRGFSSCMAGFGDSPYHPVRLYALPQNNLSLAYLTHNGEPDGAVVARAICNTKNKCYVRIYGDARLGEALKSNFGMTNSPCEALNGVKCAAIENDGDLVAPYIDGGMEIEWDGCSDTCMIVTDGNYDAENTEGVACKKCSSRCGCCGDLYDEEDLQNSEHHDISICNGCFGDSYAHAIVNRYGSTDIVDQDEVVQVYGSNYLDDRELIESFGFVWSERSEEYFRRTECKYIEYLEDYIHNDELVPLGVVTDEGDSYALEEDTIIILLKGESLRVHCDYDGPRDDEDDEEDEKSDIDAALECAA